MAIALFRGVEDAARSASEVAPALDALYQRYVVLERLGEAKAVLDELSAGLQAAEEHRLAHQAGRMLEAIGRVRYTHGEYEEAVRCWSRCVRLCEATGDLRSGVESRIGLGAVFDATGEGRTSARFHDEALALLADADEPYLRAKLALNLGVSLRAIGERAEAVKQFELARREALRGNIREYLAEAYWHLGQCALDEGDLEPAQGLVSAALTLAQACGHTWLGAAAFITLAGCYQAQDNDDRAFDAYEKGLAVAERIGACPQQTQCHDALSMLAEKRGDLAVALHHARRCMALERGRRHLVAPTWESP